MKIQLIQGHFTSRDVISIITKMIDVKIKFQEEKIKNADNEEDIKMRENRIKSLQKALYDSRKTIEVLGESVSVQSEINIGE
jgi:predicted RNase H-like nuclease (RuvC/YqgF family)